MGLRSKSGFLTTKALFVRLACGGITEFSMFCLTLEVYKHPACKKQEVELPTGITDFP
jgi:hypothetical protein